MRAVIGTGPGQTAGELLRPEMLACMRPQHASCTWLPHAIALPILAATCAWRFSMLLVVLCFWCSSSCQPAAPHYPRASCRTAVTEDGKRSAQFEHTLLITSTGCEVLTERLPTSPPLWWEKE